MQSALPDALDCASRVSAGCQSPLWATLQICAWLALANQRMAAKAKLKVRASHHIAKYHKRPYFFITSSPATASKAK
eukprot:2251436-Amphidinium_carterae.1